MSMHKSLKSKNQHLRSRNVLSREERLERLAQQERWKEGDSVFGLPKVRVQVIAPRKRKAKEEEAAAEGEGVVEEAEAAEEE